MPLALARSGGRAGEALEDASQLADAAAELAWVDGGEAELEAVARDGATVEAMEADQLEVWVRAAASTSTAASAGRRATTTRSRERCA